jgi:AMP-polyphosphate phosphotransferase
MSILDRVDLSLDLDGKEYKRRLVRGQVQLRELQFRCYKLAVPTIVVFEGWDAAGKGGVIRELSRALDPRGFTVTAIGAPSVDEKAHHYLWRFWSVLPAHGHMALFDRSWYGRVLVERIEGFAAESEWRRAYREINEFEEHLAAAGTVIAKFWLHISCEEQLHRFAEREDNPYKRYKLTDEDWRNRSRRDAYHEAVDEMLLRTSTTYAPWTVVPANSKRHARVQVVETLALAMNAAMDAAVKRRRTRRKGSAAAA